MYHYWMEVENKEIIALHESTSDNKPDGRYGGSVLPLGEHTYNILRAVDGDVSYARILLDNLCESLGIDK